MGSGSQGILPTGRFMVALEGGGALTPAPPPAAPAAAVVAPDDEEEDDDEVCLSGRVCDCG